MKINSPYLTLTVPMECHKELLELCDENGIDTKNKAIPHLNFNAEIDLNTTLVLLIGSAPFWIALTNIIKILTNKTDVEVKIYKSNINFSIKAKEKNIEKILKKIADEFGNKL